MPLEFLSDAQVAGYGRFSGVPSQADLEWFFVLDDADRGRIADRRGDHNRLGLVLQATTVRYVGRFLAAGLGLADNFGGDDHRMSSRNVAVRLVVTFAVIAAALVVSVLVDRWHWSLLIPAAVIALVSGIGWRREPKRPGTDTEIQAAPPATRL